MNTLSEGIGPLNLSDADTSGFEAVEPATYNAVVHELKWDATKGGPNAKLPKGTPMLRVQFRLTDDEVDNRRVFTQFAIPPADHDAKKAAKMKGMLVRFLVALGEEESKVMSKKYDIDFDDLTGRECVVTVGKEPKRDGSTNEVIEGEYNNPVKGVKPAGSRTSSGAPSLL